MNKIHSCSRVALLLLVAHQAAAWFGQTLGLAPASFGADESGFADANSSAASTVRLSQTSRKPLDNHTRTSRRRRRRRITTTLLHAVA